MFFESFDIEVGDIVYAYRPIYNNSAEEFPEDKTVRRFLVLEKYDEEFLLISLTSKKKPVNAYQVGDSFARVNDLYLINKAFILNRLMKIDEDYMEFLLEKCVNCIKINDILYNDDIKEKVLALYKEKFCIPKFRKYEKYQIISLPNLEDSRYLIVDVSNDKYFLYRVKRDFNKSKWVYDFSNSLIFDKNCKYFLYKTLNKREIEDFLFEQK